jgi:hypothetical protein
VIEAALEEEMADHLGYDKHTESRVLLLAPKHPQVHHLGVPPKRSNREVHSCEEIRAWPMPEGPESPRRKNWPARDHPASHQVCRPERSSGILGAECAVRLAVAQRGRLPNPCPNWSRLHHPHHSTQATRSASLDP